MVTMDVAIQTDEQDILQSSRILIINPQNVHIVHPPSEEEPEADDCETEEPDADEYEEYSDEEETDEESDEESEQTPPPKKQKKYHYFGPEKDYFNTLTPTQQKTLLKVEQDVQDFHHVHIPLRFKILESPMDIRLKAHAITKLNSIRRMDPTASEYNKMMNYVESLSKIPIGKYRSLPVTKNSPVLEITSFLSNIRERLNKAVFGHEDAKEQIIRLLAQWISNPQSKGLVIGIEGVMGCGKTTLVKEGICKALGLPFGFVPLGGISDGSFLIGHSYTYEGSRWGRIAEILMECGCMNPILFFDELDKVSTTRYGEEIINILIHLTDASQSDSFHDKYFSDIGLDLSRCLVVFSYNHGDRINPILKDRMVTIKTNGYNASNKAEIALNYMLPEIEHKFSFQSGEVVLSKEMIHHIIQKTPDEMGVRNLRRSIEEIISKLNLSRLLKEDICTKTKNKISVSFPLTITKDIVDALLTSRRYENESLPFMYT